MKYLVEWVHVGNVMKVFCASVIEPSSVSNEAECPVLDFLQFKHAVFGSCM